ncbi:MAG: S9 family peptidase [Rubrivivax sp.]|nr:S9 family peptidase [Rubrivivax sp.]
MRCFVSIACGLALAAGLMAASPDTRAQARPADVPVANFFKVPALAQPTLSPDGKRIAMLVAGPDGRNALAVADVATPGKRVGVARFNDADIREFAWVNDRRLVMSLYDTQAPLGEQFLGGLYAVNADGSDFVFLVGRGRAFESQGHAAIRPLRWTHALERVLRDGTDDVIVKRYNFLEYEGQAGSTTLLRLNTQTRATRELIKDPPPNAMDWVFDAAGVARAAVSSDGRRTAQVFARASAEAPWVSFGSVDMVDPAPGSFSPVGFEPDGRMIVSALRGDAARTTALFHFDMATRKLAERPFFALQGYDIDSGAVFDGPSRRLIGVRYTADAAGTAWLDDEMRAIQERVDKLLPDGVNTLYCGLSCKQQSLHVVETRSDRQPPVYFLFDKSKEGRASLTLLGASRPWIDAAQMGTQDMVRVKARDGLEMPVYLTKPQGKGPWPTVVLVHGGPFVRGHEWGWNADAQFLASRGYLVVEAEFRGSTGYGAKHFRAGWKQWGLKMQDDVTDATRWAVAQGLADPRRLVIAGASYGGYAAMMGLVKEPDLYRAGINWVGVTDIELMYSVDWSDFAGSAWQRYGLPALVGDREKDKAQLDATSPLKRAREITKPVLMAYGSEDFRVPLPHGTRMRDALKDAGKVEVEWVVYEQEGHGFMLEKNLVDFWTRVERFLARHTR